MANPLEGQIADYVVAYYEANEGALTAFLTSQNQKVSDLVVQLGDKLAGNIPVVGGLIENALKSNEPGLVAFFGSEEKVGVAALDSFLKAEAKKLGG